MEKNLPTYQCPLCGGEMKCDNNVGYNKEWHIYCNKCHAGILFDSIQAAIENMPKLITRINPYITRIEYRNGKVQIEM